MPSITFKNHKLSLMLSSIMTIKSGEQTESLTAQSQNGLGGAQVALHDCGPVVVKPWALICLQKLLLSYVDHDILSISFFLGQCIYFLSSSGLRLMITSTYLKE